MNRNKLSRITITRMQIGEYEVPIPHGLSELLNSGGAWREKSEKLQNLEENYTRLVKMREGKLVTVLTKTN
jgi:hypothetical protein